MLDLKNYWLVCIESFLTVLTPKTSLARLQSITTTLPLTNYKTEVLYTCFSEKASIILLFNKLLLFISTVQPIMRQAAKRHWIICWSWFALMFSKLTGVGVGSWSKWTGDKLAWRHQPPPEVFHLYGLQLKVFFGESWLLLFPCDREESQGLTPGLLDQSKKWSFCQLKF